MACPAGMNKGWRSGYKDLPHCSQKFEQKTKRGRMRRRSTPPRFAPQDRAHHRCPKKSELALVPANVCFPQNRKILIQNNRKNHVLTLLTRHSKLTNHTNAPVTRMPTFLWRLKWQNVTQRLNLSFILFLF